MKLAKCELFKKFENWTKSTWPIEKIVKKMRLRPSDSDHFATIKMTCQNSFPSLIPSWESPQQNVMQLKIKSH